MNVPRARHDAAEAGAMWKSRHDLNGQVRTESFLLTTYWSESTLSLR